MLNKEKDYYDGPYKQMPFVGGRALPVQVVVQIRPDGTPKFRICRDVGMAKGRRRTKRVHRHGRD